MRRLNNILELNNIAVVVEAAQNLNFAQEALRIAHIVEDVGDLLDGDVDVGGDVLGADDLAVAALANHFN